MKIELKEEIKDKLAEAIEMWAEEGLKGKPAIVATAMYFNLEKAMIEQIEKINETFK